MCTDHPSCPRLWHGDSTDVSTIRGCVLRAPDVGFVLMANDSEKVPEARGLDVTPGMIEKLRALGDDATADILEIILREEVAHVAAGSRWYRWYCGQQGVEPLARFRELLRQYAGGYLHGPFNTEARLQAGFDEDELAALEAPSDA